MGWFWDANIETAREKEDGDELSEPGYDGNRTYGNSGTYGQTDYTVRERADGTLDVYVSSDSEKGHSHDHIDADGNILEHYHDCLISKMFLVSEKELVGLKFDSRNECFKKIEIMLAKESSGLKLIRKLEKKD
ncbi:MAG: hypothetical protein IJN03_01640 [Bacilli bacterium]|nr:hypothetical protein [Bacilli bacterium]